MSGEQAKGVDLSEMRERVYDAVQNQAYTLRERHLPGRFVLCSRSVALLMPRGWTLDDMPLVAGAAMPEGAHLLNPGAKMPLWVRVVPGAYAFALGGG